MPTRKEKYDRRSWTSVEQWHWLYERYPAYRAAQRVNTRHTFLGGLYHDWFVEWPEIRILHDHGEVKLLSDEEKKLFEEAAAEARDYQRKVAREMEAKSREFLVRSGMQINDVPAEEIARMRETVRPVIDKYAPQVGEALVKEFYDELAKARGQKS